MTLLAYLLPTITLVVFGQLVTKWRVAYLSGQLHNDVSGWERLIAYLTDPWIILAYMAVFASSVTWMFVIEKFPLSLAFPMHIGITVLAVVIGGMLFWGEPLTTSRGFGILLIITGVTIVSRV